MTKRRLPRDARFAPDERLRKLFTSRGRKATHRRERREADLALRDEVDAALVERGDATKRPETMYDVALHITDETFGNGSYAESNAGHPDPGVQAAITRWKQDQP